MVVSDLTKNQLHNLSRLEMERDRLFKMMTQVILLISSMEY